MRSSAIRPMPTPSSTASSTTLIVLISPATACGEPARDQPQRIDPSLTNRQNQTASRTPLKRATSCRNSERHDLGMTRRHRRNQHAGFGELYDGKRKPGPITEAACWSHGRRHFFEQADLRKAPLAVEAVRRIDDIFAIERRINGQPAGDRLAGRRGG